MFFFWYSSGAIEEATEAASLMMTARSRIIFRFIKKIMTRNLVLAVVLAALALPANAQESYTLACQYTEDAGLKWENRGWALRNFRPDDPFFLKVANGRLTTETVARVVEISSPENVSCMKNDFSTYEACMDYLGGSLFFDYKNYRGGISQLYGSTNTGDSRDSIRVSTFICQRV